MRKQIIPFHAACVLLTFSFLTATASESVFSLVPETEAEGYVALYELDLPLDAGFRGSASVPYQTDNSLAVPEFDRVAYYLELTNDDGTQWVYVSMDAFTNDPQKLGLPHSAHNPVVHQQNVRNMTVASNVAGIQTGSFIDTGHIEMWPSDYFKEDTYGVFAADHEQYDWGDSGASTQPGYGSFQIHNPLARQTLLAYNGWGAQSGSPDDVGIGNSARGYPDWTFAQNADAYTERKLVVLVRPRTFHLDFSDLPRNRQLFSRDLTTNRAIVPIAGSELFGGYDRIILRIHRNGTVIDEVSHPLHYEDGRAAFSFAPEIEAELASYHFELLLVQDGTVKRAELVQDVVAGDAYLFYGQSNAVAESYDESGRSANEYASPWLRTFGQNGDSGSHARNILYWMEAEGNGAESDPASIGQWAMVLGRQLIDTYQVPVAILNGARGGYRIDRLQKDRENPDALDDRGSTRRPYNRLRYRAIQSGISETARALFYYQGEHDQSDAQAHADGFARLREDWAVDYPGLERIYVTQVRRGCGVPNDQPFLPDAQRRFGDVYPDVSVMASNGIPNHDGCHFLFPGGYEDLGIHHFRKVARDLYGGPDGPNIDALNPEYVTFSNPDRTELKVVLRNVGATIHFPTGALGDFVLTGTAATITARSLDGHVFYLSLSEPADPETVLDYRGHRRDSEWITNANGVGMLSFVEPVLEFTLPPDITSHPASISVRQFDPATFSVSATGSGLRYRWQQSDNGSEWVTIPGATGSTYTIEQAEHAMDGNRYRVLVSNREGSVTSEEAVLTVESVPALAPEEFTLLVVGLKIGSYQFLSSERFWAESREGEWVYQRTGATAGLLVFTYDDDSREEVVVDFDTPNVIIGEVVLEPDRLDFFGLLASPHATRFSPWLGAFDQTYFDHSRNRGWIAHEEHGWLYAAGRGYAAGMWLWDHIQQDWLWTRAGVHPFFFSDARQTWLYYEEGGRPEKRWFYSYEESINDWFPVNGP